jgi:hypothetical protein
MEDAELIKSLCRYIADAPTNLSLDNLIKDKANLIEMIQDLTDEGRRVKEDLEKLRATRPGTYEEGVADGQQHQQDAVSALTQENTKLRLAMEVLNNLIAELRTQTNQVVPGRDRCVCGAEGPPFHHLPPYPCSGHKLTKCSQCGQAGHQMSRCPQLGG